MFRVARDHGEQLRQALALTPFAREEFEASYAETSDPLERARRMVTFRVARDHGEKLRQALTLTPFARDEFEASYVETTDPLERARRLVITWRATAISSASAAKRWSTCRS